MNPLAPLPLAARAPALIAAVGDRASYRFLEFFAGQIRNPNSRRAYLRATGRFLLWLEAQGVPSIAAVTSLHVAAYVEELTRRQKAPTVKQQLAAIRRLLDWLAAGGVIAFNPASAVRGPSYSAKTGATPVLSPAEARQLSDAIDTTTPAGLRDRALIALMVYSLARVGAALGMTVEDVFSKNRRLWVRLLEKGGKAAALPHFRCSSGVTLIAR